MNLKRQQLYYCLFLSLTCSVQAHSTQFRHPDKLEIVNQAKVSFTNGADDLLLSPDGTKIAYTRQVSGPRGDHELLCLRTVDGAHDLVLSKAFSCGTPLCFSSDGRFLLFSGIALADSHSETFSLWRIQISTGVFKRSAPALIVNDAMFSSDDKYLLCDSSGLIYISSSTGANVQILRSGFAPQWSASAQHIAYLVPVPASAQCHIYILDRSRRHASSIHFKPETFGAKYFHNFVIEKYSWLDERTLLVSGESILHHVQLFPHDGDKSPYQSWVIATDGTVEQDVSQIGNTVSNTTRNHKFLVNFGNVDEYSLLTLR